MQGRFKTRKQVVEKWANGGEMSLNQLAKELDIDQGNFSKMLNNEIEPSKLFMRKLIVRTGYNWESLFEFDRDAISED